VAETRAAGKGDAPDSDGAMGTFEVMMRDAMKSVGKA
jgi:hypothetical protein